MQFELLKKNKIACPPTYTVYVTMRFAYGIALRSYSANSMNCLALFGSACSSLRAVDFPSDI